MTNITDEQVKAVIAAYRELAVFEVDYDRDIHAIREGIRRAEAAAWRPIEEAPKDGTPIMMAQQPDGKQTLYPRYCVAAYQTIPGGGALLLDWQYGGQPTHFRYFSPLPEPPKEPK